VIPVRDTFPPIPTGAIPLPIVEEREEIRAGEGGLPRILLQAAGAVRAARNVSLLTGLFLLIAILELGLCLRLPRPVPVIVYGEFPRITLLGPGR
jgi:hypothetical protein